MNIKGIEGLTNEQVSLELENGARFVVYEYCISVLILTFKRPSDIYFVRPGQSRFGPGFKYTLVSLVAGWWGIPWGPIYTLTSLVTNCCGGRDITDKITASAPAA